jgi:hypothetical protein
VLISSGTTLLNLLPNRALFDLPLVSLLRANRHEIYGSGGLASYQDKRLAEQPGSMDPNGTYTRKQALAFAGKFGDFGVTWCIPAALKLKTFRRPCARTRGHAQVSTGRGRKPANAIIATTGLSHGAHRMTAH